MDLSLIVSLAIFIFLAFMAFVLIKKAIKAILFIIILFIAFIFLFGFFVISDFNNFRDNFSEKQNIALLKDNDLIAGLKISDKINLFSVDEFAQVIEDFHNKEYRDILKDNYKLVMVDIEAIENLNIEEITINDKTLTKNTLIDTFKSGNPKQELSKEGIELTDILLEKEIGGTVILDSDVKSALFAIVFDDYIMESPFYLTLQIKKGNVIFYPETPFFKFIKYLPTNFVKNMVDKAITKAKEKIG